MKTKTRTILEFEQSFGQPKLKQLQRDLAVEREKVDMLAGTRDKVYVEKQTDKNTLRFALFGDTQIGNAYACPENLAAFFKIAVDRGCEVAFHTGDVLDGWKVYKGQEFELRDIGFEAQLKRLESDVPRGIPVKFITGNHDASFKNLAGISVGKAIERRFGLTGSLLVKIKDTSNCRQQAAGHTLSVFTTWAAEQRTP